MIQAAGILILTGGDKRSLFVKCADTGLWTCPGGKIEGSETALDAAEREAKEEIGNRAFSDPSPLMRRIADGVDFTTFVARTDNEFTPTLSDEHLAWTWAPTDAPPEPLHPGCRVALARLTMDELGIARVMSVGDMVSPQKYGNIWLFALRLTGTGVSYRDSHKEYCWRDPAIYLDPEFLARCNGLPVVFNHPDEKPTLDHQEFTDRISGTVFLPYVQGDEVWAIAKIWRDECVEFMLSDQVSTSPGVAFKEATSTNETIKLSDGTTLLLEGKPALLDHVAVCTAGVWDKGGPPTGVLNDFLTRGTSAMPDDTNAVADQAQKDATAKLNAILDGIGRITGRLDAVEGEIKARKDAEDKEKARADRRDAARKDRFGARKDGESYKDWKGRHDADEMAMCDALKDSEESEDERKKFAKDARKDAEDDEAENDKEFAKWAEEEMEEPNHQGDDDAKKDAAKKDAARKDEGEKRKEEEENARKDAAVKQENTDLKARLDALTATITGLTRVTPASERDELAKIQSRHDSVVAMFGTTADSPLPGETPRAYRIRLLSSVQAHSERFKNSRFDALDDSQLGAVSDVVYHDAIAAAKSPGRALPGRLHETVTIDAAGRRISTYTGDPMAWMGAFMGQGQSGRVIQKPNA